MYKNDASKANSPCIFSHSFKAKSDLKKSSRRALQKVLLYLFEQVVFSRFIFRSLFWLEKCEHEARSCTCHSPRTVLAAASILAMLVLYQLLLKCTKCQYKELTRVSSVWAGLVLSAWAGIKSAYKAHKQEGTIAATTCTGKQGAQTRGTRYIFPSIPTSVAALHGSFFPFCNLELISISYNYHAAADVGMLGKMYRVPLVCAPCLRACCCCYSSFLFVCSTSI